MAKEDLRFWRITQGCLGTNSVVLCKNNQLVVVDIPFESDQLCDFVNRSGKKVVAVLLTHGHFDHCGGVKNFLEKCQANVPVFVNENDVDLCRRAAENPWQLPAENCFPTDFAREGSLDIGDFRFTVLETPGHTSGSVAYAVENLLLTGDTLMKGTVGRTDFPESVPQKMAASLQKLKTIQGEFVVIGGHGDSSSLTYEKQHNPFLKTR